MNRIKILANLFKYFWKNKLWWIIPVLIIFLFFGLLTLVVGSSPLAPIVYPLF